MDLPQSLSIIPWVAFAHSPRSLRCCTSVPKQTPEYALPMRRWLSKMPHFLPIAVSTWILHGNIITPEEVMWTIEALAFNKFNRLHLRASDAQSWPLKMPVLPDLASKGAYRPDQIWTAADLHEVQQFGSYRGVEVYLEIDMPGHTASIHAAYPDLIQSQNRQPCQTSPPNHAPAS